MRIPRSWVLGVLVPFVIIVVILTADSLEGPKTAYVGVLAVVPMFAAVFGTPLSTLIVGIVTWISAFLFGHLAADGNVTAQSVRLLIIAMVIALAVFAAYLRTKQEERLAEAERAAAEASQFRALADTDLLTEIANRRGAIRAIEGREWQRECTVALLDLDNLKHVNDSLGHAAGDDYIRAIAGRLAQAVSRRDVVGRWGGDEFIIVLDLPLEEARGVLERMHAHIVREPVRCGLETIDASASLGATQWVHGEALDFALSRADSSLYGAKSNGRNRLVIVA